MVVSDRSLHALKTEANEHTKDSKLRKDSACGDLGSNRSQLAPPSGCVVQNGVHVVAPLCCAVLVLGTWRLVSCCLWSWGCSSVSVFIPQ